jgi:hypothetical protein
MLLERTVIIGNARRSNCGLGFGFVVCLAIAAGAVYLGIHGHDWLGGALATGALGSVVATFVYGRESAKKERIEKNTQLQSPSRKK